MAGPWTDASAAEATERATTDRAFGPATGLADWVAERIGGFEAAAATIASASEAAPELLHRFHQEARRLDLALKVLRRLSSRPPRPTERSVAQRLRSLSRLSGEVRDLDIGLDLLTIGRARRLDAERRERVERLARHFAEGARSGRAVLGAHVRAELAAGLPAELRTRLGRLRSIRSGAAGATVLYRIERRQRARLRRALKRARRRPTIGRLHALRRTLRASLQIAELADRLRERPARSRSVPIRRLQEELGELHDLDLIAAALEEFEEDDRDGIWGRLLERRAALRGSILERLEAPALRRRLRAIGRSSAAPGAARPAPTRASI